MHSRCLAALIPWDLPYCCVLNDMVRILNTSAPQLTIRSRYKRFSSGGNVTYQDVLFTVPPEGARFYSHIKWLLPDTARISNTCLSEEMQL